MHRFQVTHVYFHCYEKACFARNGYGVSQYTEQRRLLRLDGIQAGAHCKFYVEEN